MVGPPPATPLTYDTWKLPAFLQDAKAGQGGDIPEAVFEAVSNAAERLNWRENAHKVVVYAGDAAHHVEDEPIFLSRMVRVVYQARRFVVENCLGLGERHAMLTAVHQRLGRIPLEAQSHHEDIISTTYLHVKQE